MPLLAATRPRTITSSTFLRYLAVGGFNTFLGLGIICLLKWWLNAGDAVANMCGYAVGVVVSFFLNKKLTFQFQGANVAVILKFTAVIWAAYAANILVVMVSVRLGLNAYLAQMTGVAPYTVISYLGCRFFVFRHQARS